MYEVNSVKRLKNNFLWILNLISLYKFAMPNFQFFPILNIHFPRLMVWVLVKLQIYRLSFFISSLKCGGHRRQDSGYNVFHFPHNLTWPHVKEPWDFVVGCFLSGSHHFVQFDDHRLGGRGDICGDHVTMCLKSYMRLCVVPPPYHHLPSCNFFP